MYPHAIASPAAAHFGLMSTSVINHLWRQSLFANRLYGMNPSEADKGNQEEKKDRADSDKTRLVPDDLEIPEGDEEEHKEPDLPPAMPPKV
jgi:hypothetical protein